MSSINAPRPGIPGGQGGLCSLTSPAGQAHVVGPGELDPSPRKLKNESPPAPDSTTEPGPMPVMQFQEGEDVYFRNDEGQHVFGTVGQVAGQACQILFDDGTEQWASFSRVLKSLNQEQEKGPSPSQEEGRKTKVKVEQITPPTPNRPQQTELSCTSCGITRKISSKKARLYEGNSGNLFQCRPCIKQKQSDSAVSIPSPTSRNPHNIGPYLIPPSALHTKLPPDISIIPMSKSPGFPLPSASTSLSLKGFSKAQTPDGTITIPRQIQFSVLPGKTLSAACFHCEKSVRPYDRVHCNMCENPCHLMCLPLNPSPLAGDKFWDLLCSSCGNQNTNEKVRVFSVRRNITSWADIAHLLISCLSVSSSQRMFDLETEMINFLEANIDKLHLPRQYKSPAAEARHKYLLNALTTSRIRFQNGREIKRKNSLWGLRTDPPIPNVSYAQDKKKQISTIAREMGLKPSSSKAEGKMNVTPKPVPNPLPSKINLKKTVFKFAKTVAQVPKDKRSLPVVSETDESDNSSSLTNESSPSTSAESSSSTKWNEKTDVAKDMDKIASTVVANVSRELCKESKPTTTPVKIIPRERTRSPIVENDSETSSTTSQDSKDKKVVSKSASSKDLVPKLKGQKRSLPKDSPSPKIAVKAAEPSSKKDRLRVRLPLPKKLKIEKDHVKGGKSGPDCHAQKVACKSPSKTKLVVFEGGWTSESDNDNDNVLDESNGTDRVTPRAIKTAHLVPLPAPRVQKEIKTPTKETPPTPPIKTGKPGRPKNSTNSPTKPKPEKTPMVSRLRARGRGRPIGSTKTQAKPNTKPGPKNFNLKLTLRPNGITVSKSGAPLTLSRRVGTFNSISERRPSQLVIQNTEPSSNPISVISSSLLDAAIFGDYRMACLPRTPQTEEERKAEALKVFSHLRTERENETAAFLLGRSETETRSQTRRKAELFVGRQKRDLNDYDSYEVIAKRVDADGITRYQVLWKGCEEEDDEEMEIENCRHASSPEKILILSPIKVKAEVNEEDGVKQEAGGRNSPDPIFLIDLTDD